MTTQPPDPGDPAPSAEPVHPVAPPQPESEAPRPAPSEPPPKLPFPLHASEQITKVCRRHWLYLWPSIAMMVVFAIALPLAVAWLLDKIGGLSGTSGKIYGILALLYILYWAYKIFSRWYSYHNDIWVITNQRLVDSRRTNPFNLTVSSADLVNVQDMTVERRGILQTTLDYGDVVCQTSADVQEFRISGVPDPRGVQALVDRERDRERMRYRSP
ncbi:MAG TPA: hypothetical protein VH951_14150 [Dehalococcoidia bacterium]|jgi:hypothetical protein